METDFIFNKGLDLPAFASFDLLSTQWGRETLKAYYLQYLELAEKFQSGFILETPTWRANPDWGATIGYDLPQIEEFNREAVKLLEELRGFHSSQYPASEKLVLISGNVGPRGDGYKADNQMTIEEARHYHQTQINVFADASVDLVSAFTLNYVEEALGVVLAARTAKIPVVISFTVETDGNLPSGESLGNAIATVDAESENYPLYYMINCAHPTHFEHCLAGDQPWKSRILGIRGNASRCSHAELDEATTLDDGNPLELGEDYHRLQQLLPALRVYGGCCGTDYRHVASIAEACLG